jgi:hypothetical protein
MGHIVSNARMVVKMERVAVRDVGALDGVEEMSRNKSVLRASLLLFVARGVHDGPSSVVAAVTESTESMGDAVTKRCCFDNFWRMLLDVASPSSTTAGVEEKDKDCLGGGGANAFANCSCTVLRIHMMHIMVTTSVTTQRALKRPIFCRRNRRILWLDGKEIGNQLEASSGNVAQN